MIPAKDCFLMHGEYVKVGDKGRERDAYIGFVKSVVDERSEMIIVNNPEVSVYVTKPQLRTNTIKKECIKRSDCDMYRTKLLNMSETLFNAINNPGRHRPVYGYLNQKKLLSDPYVYGADIDYGVHLKFAYNKANGKRTPNNYNVGALDIETDVNGTNQIILITYMNGDGRTFVGVLKEFYKDHTVDEAMRLWKKTEQEFRSKLKADKKDNVQKLYDEAPPIKIDLQIFDKEIDLIKWVFARLHECRPDFCGIWNIDYDIPYILDRLAFRGVDPADVFCSEDIPKQWRVCKYHHDKGKKDSHITDYWHWLHLTDYTCYIDFMCLYGRLRKAKGRDSSYRLNDIGAKEIGAGKLEFGEGEGHSTMQKEHQVEYTVYNIVDVLILHVMEMKNNDVRNLVMLSGDSMFHEFNHQSIQLKNSFYVYLDDIGMIPGSIGDPLDQPWDKYLENTGGAVLDPERTPLYASFAPIAVPCLKETDDTGRAARFVCDLDVTSEYPSCDQAFNITRETKIATMLNIDNTKRAGKIINIDDVIINQPDVKNVDVESFCFLAIYPESNALKVGQVFGLPDFDGIDRFIQENHPELIRM